MRPVSVPAPLLSTSGPDLAPPPPEIIKQSQQPARPLMSLSPVARAKPPERGSLTPEIHPRHVWRNLAGSQAQSFLEQRRRKLLRTLAPTHVLHQRCELDNGRLIRPAGQPSTPRQVTEDPALRQRGKKKSKKDSHGIDWMFKRNLALRMIQRLMTKTGVLCDQDVPSLKKIKEMLDGWRWKFGFDLEDTTGEWERVWVYIMWKAGRRHRREMRLRRRVGEPRTPLEDITANSVSSNAQHKTENGVQHRETEVRDERKVSRAVFAPTRRYESYFGALNKENNTLLPGSGTAKTETASHTMGLDGSASHRDQKAHCSADESNNADPQSQNTPAVAAVGLPGRARSTNVPARGFAPSRPSRLCEVESAVRELSALSISSDATSDE